MGSPLKDSNNTKGVQLQLKNQHIMITGANRGIGLGLSKMAATEGAHLHIVTRTPQRELKQQLQSLGAASVKNWIADLGSRQDTAKLIDQLAEQDIDILINNAGLLTGGLIEEQNLDEIYQMFQVNLLSLIQLSRGLLPRMLARKKGLIVNNSSVSAIMHFPCASTYAASKSAVLTFSHCLQMELQGTGVSVLALITPGIKTEMFDQIEQKYSKNFEVPTESISTEEYANLVRQAIYDNCPVLLPNGMTKLGLWSAQYLPWLFKREVLKRFRRTGP